MGVLAGPVLIAGGVLLVLHDFAFRGMITDQHIDLLSFWLPTHCFLGTSLAAGTIPVWNPHVMAGLPFAADPQSGWMYLPAMALHTMFPCGAALRLFIVLQPLLAGLGIFWFLRSEQVSRLSATVGGLALSLGMAASTTVVSLPIAGSFAWTALLLAVASRSLRASTWSARLGWGTAAALAWGQLAAAHLSHGLVIGTGALLFYALARMASVVQGSDGSARQAVLALILLLGLLLPANLAYFLPRIGYLPETSLGLGYRGLEELAARLSGSAPVAFEAGPAAGLSWPLRFATSPGAYVGAIPLALSFGGWWSRRHRRLAVSFSVFGLLCYVASLDVVAQGVGSVVRSLPLGDFYLHEPLRFRYGLFLVLSVLAALGVEAWRTAASARRRASMLILGIVVWAGFSLLLPVEPGRLLLPSVAAVVGIGVLLVAARRAAIALLLPVLLAVELVANGLLGQAAEPVRADQATLGRGWGLPFVNLVEPRVPAADYLRPGRIAAFLRSAADPGRFLSVPRGQRGFRTSSYFTFWDPKDRGFLNNQRAILFRLEDAQGYNPVQLRPFWMFVRRNSAPSLRHNRAVLRRPSATVLDLLQVTWIIGAADSPPMRRSTMVTREEPWALYRRPGPPRATLLREWLVEPDELRALQIVSTEGFDPGERVVLDRRPGLEPLQGPGGPGRVRYQQVGSGEVRITVEAPSTGILLVRNSYERNWHATIDGRPTDVLRANFFLQGIPVPQGHSVVRLRFDDPTLGRGLVASGAVLLIVLGAAAALWVSERRRA